MSIQTINPSTNKTEKSFGEMTEKALDEAVAQAASAYNYWKKIGYKNGLTCNLLKIPTHKH